VLYGLVTATNKQPQPQNKKNITAIHTHTPWNGDINLTTIQYSACLLPGVCPPVPHPPFTRGWAKTPRRVRVLGDLPTNLFFQTFCQQQSIHLPSTTPPPLAGYWTYLITTEIPSTDKEHSMPTIFAIALFIYFWNKSNARWLD
jgi:hypothetical protein